MGKEINDFDDQNELRPTHNNLKDLDVIKIDIDKIKEEMFKSMDIIEEDLN